MSILTIILVLLCIATGCFSIGAVSGSKLGSAYKSTVTMKTSLVFVVSNLLALCLSFVVGKLLYNNLYIVSTWLTFSFLFLIGVRLLLESIEKSPSLNYTDIVQSTYLIRVAVQASVDSFMFGFIISLVADKTLFFVLLLSAVFNFFATTFGLSHGHAFPKTVLGNRMELAAGIIMIVVSVFFLLTANG